MGRGGALFDRLKEWRRKRGKADGVPAYVVFHDRTLAEIASDLGISKKSLRRWTKQQDIDEGAREGLTSDEREEIARLRKENRVLREERDILKRATAFFAKETR